MDPRVAENLFSKEEQERNRTDVCEECLKEVENNQEGIQCDNCNKWFHNSCVGLKNVPKKEWCCPYCLKGGVKKKIDNIYKKKEFENFVSTIPVCYCEKCGETFKTVEDLDIHEIIHLTADGNKKKKSTKKKKKVVRDGRSKKTKSFRRSGGKKKKK